MPKTKKDKDMSVCETKFSQILAELEMIREIIKALTAVPKVEKVEEEIKEEIVEKKQETQFPVPSEYREIVSELLSSEFGVQVVPDPTGPKFTLQIFVPKKYSNAPDETWQTAKADLRAKPLTYGEGLLGVRTYVELVRANLGPSILARIEADKANH